MEIDGLTQAEMATNAQTWEHIDLIMKLLASAQIELMRRQFTHDRSKLVPPEVSTFTEMTPKLAGSTYGSEEYKGFLAYMTTALDHHYAHNRHHPEFYPTSPEDEELGSVISELKRLDAFCHYPSVGAGEWVDAVSFAIAVLERKQVEQTARINKMNLFDLLEMLIDWCAAVRRHDDGNIQRSIEINTERFALSPQLRKILENTVPWIEDEFAALKTQVGIAKVRGLDL